MCCQSEKINQTDETTDNKQIARLMFKCKIDKKNYFLQCPGLGIYSLDFFLQQNYLCMWNNINNVISNRKYITQLQVAS